MSVLQYHYKPAHGWMNDPNGLVFFNGYYHAFYQYIPDAELPTKPMSWGHARTKDFVTWEELPIALYPDRPYDQGGAWSGTAIEKDGVLYLFYASVVLRDNVPVQTISVAFSRDGLHFEKYENNPVIDHYPADGSEDFRDPAIFSENGKNYLVIASGQEGRKKGNLLLYTADDFFHWTYAGVLIDFENTAFCECPSFVKMGDKYLLSTSVCAPDEHWFEVMVGDFDGRTFTPRIRSRFQKGPDEYAGQIFRAPDGRVILISWVGGWHHREYEPCVGCLSLPLEISEKDGKLVAYPVRELRHLVQDGKVVDGYVEETFVRGGEEVYIRLLPEKIPFKKIEQ